ncbi:hypothetical protein MTR67_017828 [Solanum verrucosum]|uniref:Uncharacterized protein n=1 Tax=Solanum verrucosum TaxID=315347 RepID=A0AAF0TSK2_SOLVR|nr:hypothetical protein MTR67_017828 [Solanum verrucosum]
MSDSSLIINIENVGVKNNLSYEKTPVEILDRQNRKLRTKEVASVKENEPTVSSCSTGKAVEEVVATDVEEDAEDRAALIDDLEDIDVVIRCWILGTLIEESLYLIVDFSTAKEM